MEYCKKCKQKLDECPRCKGKGRTFEGGFLAQTEHATIVMVLESCARNTGITMGRSSSARLNVKMEILSV